MKRKDILTIGLVLGLAGCGAGEAVLGVLEIAKARDLNATGTVAAGVLASCDVEKIQLGATMESLIATNQFLETKVAEPKAPAQIQEVTRVVTVKETSVVVEQKPCEPATSTPTPTKTNTRRVITFTPSSTRRNTATPLPPTFTRVFTVTSRPPTDTPRPQDTQPPKTDVPNTQPPVDTQKPPATIVPDRPTTAPQTAIPTLTR